MCTPVFCTTCDCNHQLFPFWPVTSAFHKHATATSLTAALLYCNGGTGNADSGTSHCCLLDAQGFATVAAGVRLQGYADIFALLETVAAKNQTALACVWLLSDERTASGAALVAVNSAFKLLPASCTLT